MPRRMTVSAVAVMVVMGLWIVSDGFEVGQAHAQQRESSSPQLASPPGRISLTVKKGRLTASIKDCPMGSVLEELDLQTDVALIPAKDLDIAEDRVSAQLADVPLDEGLRRLLENYDTFLYYGVVGNAPSSLRAVWIYPKGTASVLRPVPPEAWASSKELEASLADWYPEVRERAYEALMLRPSSASRELVLQALRGASETDEGVRQRLLSSAISNGMRLPPDLLTELARWDGSEGIRLMALDALAGDPALKELAQAVSADPSQAVREKAKEILAQLRPEYRPDGANPEPKR
jgi:hypothetical protein